MRRLLAGACLFLTGCTALPHTVTVRDPHGNLLATANTQTGEIQLTHIGLHVLQPKLILPRAK